MKNIIAILAAALLAIGCSSKDAATTTVSFKSYVVRIEQGDTFQLEPLIGDTREPYDLLANSRGLSFSTENPDIATITPQGLITGVGIGSTALKISGKGIEMLRDITVQVLAKSTRLTVMSFNTKVDDRSGTSTDWSQRRDGAVAMIKANNPDLMGLQEGQPHQITYLSKNLPDYKWYGIGRDTGKVPATTDSYASEECMAIFYNTKVLKMEDCGTFWLSETPEQISLGWDGACRRTCTWARFTVLSTGKTVYYFNTHLDHKGSTARQESIKLIVKKMAEINPEGAPSYLTADFNSDTSNAIFDPLKLVMSDARVVAPVTDNHKTYHNYESVEGKKVIDHIWFAGAGNACNKYHTVYEAYAGVQFVSDHFPVYANFTVR